MMNLFLTKENVAIHYKTKGSGYPIILLHGVFKTWMSLNHLLKS